MKILVILLAAFVLLTATHAASQADAPHAERLAGVETNLLPALTNAIITTVLTNSALPEMAQAEQFLHELKLGGHLPGVPQDSHGNISVDGPLSEFEEAKYPFTVTFDLVLNGDSLTNHYTVTRPVQDAAWRLEKAWRTDMRGRMFVEWPVK